jgi:hypothetical protein
VNFISHILEFLIKTSILEIQQLRSVSWALRFFLATSVHLGVYVQMLSRRQRDDVDASGPYSYNIATWNIAAINNNPFEYWVSYPDSSYNEFMQDVEQLLADSNFDVCVNEIFTEKMFLELIQELSLLGVCKLDELSVMWTSDFSKRRAISGFLKDPLIGEKRLTSLPDRITNTINLMDGTKICRPSVINAYDGCSLSSIENWWEVWKEFMFRTSVKVCSHKSQECTPQLISSLIGQIHRNKYPAVTIYEQAISIPLQILCLAILDSIFLYVVISVSSKANSSNSWESIRRVLSHSLIHGKDDRVCAIIADSYKDTDVFFLQEATAALVRTVSQHTELSKKFLVLLPEKMDGKRDQNSIILVDRQRFRASTSLEVTQTVAEYVEGNFLEPGDLLAVSIEDTRGDKWLLVSFHGDSNGLSTHPTLLGCHQAHLDAFQNHRLLAGIDANTRSHGHDRFHRGVADLRRLLADKCMVSVWDDVDDPFIKTTCSARTSLQTQLHKAVAHHHRFSAATVSLKDWILTYAAHVETISPPLRDNTGAREYVDAQVLPTTDFPSDHAIVSATIRFRPAAPADTAAEVREPRVSDVGGAGRGPAGAGTDRETLYDYWGISDRAPILDLLCVRGTDYLSTTNSVDPVAASPGSPLLTASPARRTSIRKIPSLDMGADLALGSMGLDRSVWVLFSARPLSLALSKRWFQAMFIVTNIIYLYFGVCNCSNVLSAHGLTGRAFRLAPVLAPALDVTSMQALRGGREVAVKLRNASAAADSCTGSISGSTTLWFTEVVEVDGFECYTLASGEAHLAAATAVSVARGALSIEASDDGKVWWNVTMPLWLQARLRDGDDGYGSCKSGVRRIRWDLQPHWEWVLDWCVCPLKSSLVAAAAAALGAAGQGRRGTALLAISHAFNAAVFATVLLSRASGGDCSTLPSAPSASTAMYMLRLVVNVVVATLLAWEGPYAIDAVGLAMTAGMAAVAVQQLRISLPTATTATALHAAVTLILALFLVALQAARQCVGTWVRDRLLRCDAAEYASRWAALLARDGEVAAIQRLCVLAARWRPRLDASPPRQRQPPADAVAVPGRLAVRWPFFVAAAWRSFRRWAAAALGAVAPAKERAPGLVTSLDALYEQAARADKLLLAKARALALACRGTLRTPFPPPLAAEDEFAAVGLDTLLERDDTAPRENWKGLKPSGRAVEKLVRSYGGDPSRLLDCCR